MPTDDIASRTELSDELFEALVDRSPDGLMVIDPDGIVLLANPAAFALFCGATRDLVGFRLGAPAILRPVEMILLPGPESSPLQVEMRSCEIPWRGRRATLTALRDLTAHKRTEHALLERVKELRCLSEFVNLGARPELATDELLERAVRLLPEAWQYASDAVGSIRLDGRVFATGDPNACVATMAAAVEVEGAPAGSIAVGYLHEHPDAAEGPFLREERELLDTLSQRLGQLLWRRRAESTLRESEHRYRLLADNTLDVIWAVDERFRFTYLNPAILQLTGHAPEELLGSSWKERFDPEVLPGLDARIAEEIARGPASPGIVLETQVRHRDGTPVWVEMRGRVLFDEHGAFAGLQGSSRDITARKRAAAERERLAAAIENTAEAVLVTDTHGTIEYVNPAFETTTGYPREEAVGRSVRLLQSGEPDAPAEGELAAALARGRSWQGRLTRRRRDGSVLTVEVGVSPIRGDDGRIAGIVHAMLDVTHRLELEEKLRQAYKMESIGRLAGGVAHDFNNLLGVILGNTELALSDLDSASPARPFLEEILAAGQRSAELTRQLLAFARRQPIAPTVLDLNEVVSAMMRLLDRLMIEDIELVWRPGARLWPIEMDAGQVHQILVNLVVNARDAIDGSGRIVIETRNEVVAEERRTRHAVLAPDSYVVLAIRDDGAGMDAATSARIFEPFFTTKPTGQGTGLGLSSVHGIVHQNHGEIDVESAPGAGTTFSIYFPRAAGAEARPGQPAPAAAPATGTETILLVEDEPALLELSTLTLERLGYRVLAAGGPSEALRLAREYPERIDLLMTDVVMPGMSGRELYRELAHRPGLRCLFVSGYGADIVSRRGVLDEGVRFLQKPFDVRSLAAKLREVLDS